MLTAQSKGVSKGVNNSLDSLTGATVFETQRLRCRRFRETDAKALFEVYGDPEGSRWVGDGQPIEFDEYKDWSAEELQAYLEARVADCLESAKAKIAASVGDEVEGE